MPWVILLVLGCIAGLALGLLFFGGLWWTTQRLATSSRPALVMSVSLLVRTGVLALALVVLARSHVSLLVGAVVGIVIARIGLTRAAINGRLPQSTVPGPGTEVRS
jgi:F1F0 ATPase subunit 2